MYNGVLRATFFTLLAAILFSACTKIDTTSVGSELIPGVDNINTFDTSFNIIGTNYDNSSECDSVSRNDLQALGIISNNPLFGGSQANMYLELKPFSYPYTLPAHDDQTMVVDSVVLILRYSHSYGDSTVPQHVSVYEVSDPMDFTKPYKTCDLLSHESQLLGEKTFIPKNLDDSIHAFKENDANELRIPISNSWGLSLINNIPNISSDSAFKLFFKGFAIIADQSAGGQALNYFNLNSSATRLAVYTRSSKDTVKDSTILNLTFNGNSAQANYVHVDRNSSEITQFLSQPSTGDSILYIQSTPGSYALLKIPGLNGFPNSVINQAQIIAEQVYEPSATPFSVPRQLFIEIADPSNPGQYKLVPCDFTMTELQSGFSHFGGRPKTITNNSGQLVAQYNFDVSRYIQSIVTRGATNAVIKLSAPFYIQNTTAAYVDTCDNPISLFSFNTNNIGEGGVKLNGTNVTPTHIRLRVVYSKL
ncbi:MAG: DUF4270 family protein [Chitinophagaceae bacterium]|nr:DUF4270 family protein [Chitinophagaceae bacterium]